MWAWLLGLVCLVCEPATGDFEQADRVGPPPIVATAPPPLLWSTDSVNGSCEGARFLVTHYSPGWNVDRVLRWMYRESKCLPWAMNKNSSASGWLQILATTHCQWIRAEFGECSRQWLADPVNNIRAAASLWEKQGDSAWSL